MNYKSFNLGDWIGHISGVIEDESELDGNEMRDLVKFLTTLNKEPILDKIRGEIEAKIEEEEFARSVFRHEEKDTFKAEQCTGSIMAYNNVIKFIDTYKAESEDKSDTK